MGGLLVWVGQQHHSQLSENTVWFVLFSAAELFVLCSTPESFYEVITDIKQALWEHPRVVKPGLLPSGTTSYFSPRRTQRFRIITLLCFQKENNDSFTITFLH